MFKSSKIGAVLIVFVFWISGIPSTRLLAEENPFCANLIAAVESPNVEQDIPFRAEKISSFETSQSVTTALIQFARKNNLPMRLMEIGHPKRRVKRLFVALDANNEELVNKYLQLFNLETAVDEKTAGTLALEFEYEPPVLAGNKYITGVLRPSSNSEDPIYRWGQKDLTRRKWFRNWIEEGQKGFRQLGRIADQKKLLDDLRNSIVEQERHIKSGQIDSAAELERLKSQLEVTSQQEKQAETALAAMHPHPYDYFMAFSHLIGLSSAEKKNVDFFLANPAARGPCKSDNCVAWTSGIELGKTSVLSENEDRKYLFNELGIARSTAHFEIARRLVHAANDRHSNIIVFVNGEEGYKAFKAGNDFLPNLPKIPMDQVTLGLAYDKNSEVMKAISHIPDGAKVFIPIAAGASPTGVAALAQASTEMINGVDIHMLVNGVSASALQRGIESADGKLRIHALFLGGNLRKLYAQGLVNVIPGYLSDFNRRVRDPELTNFHYDAMIVRVAPPDNQGRYSLGPNNDMILTLLRDRPQMTVIAEINNKVPMVQGDNYLTQNQITASFNSTSALGGPAVVPRTQVETQIGTNLAKLVKTGSTLQVGIGNVFDGLPDALRQTGVKDLKISTEMMGDALFNLIQSRIAVSAEVGFAYGSENLYAQLPAHSNVKFVETEYVNNPARVAATENFVAINTALQVNLRGDVNATHGPNGRISSPGGQVEFMSGAARAPGGRAVIAIRSTAKEGSLSTIVLENYLGSVTTPHESVTHVVTEYGIAILVGKSESQRAINLISVAHPKFREVLIEQAVARKIISSAQAASIIRYDQNLPAPPPQALPNAG